jgi:hypothetical protein
LVLTWLNQILFDVSVVFCSRGLPYLNLLNIRLTYRRTLFSNEMHFDESLLILAIVKLERVLSFFRWSVRFRGVSVDVDA